MVEGLQPMPQTKRSRRRAGAHVGALPKRRHDLYYLFPGMAQGSRKRFVRNFIWSLIVGVAVAASLAGILYLVYKP
jgi:hypothetical protein